MKNRKQVLQAINVIRREQDRVEKKSNDTEGAESDMLSDMSHYLGYALEALLWVAEEEPETGSLDDLLGQSSDEMPEKRNDN